MPQRYCQSCGRQVPIGKPCKCRSTALGQRPPHFSRVHCRTCGGQARWQQTGFLNGPNPPVVYWRCDGCGSTRYQYADCTNVETMCATIMEQNLRRTGATIDHDEAHSRLVMEAWRLYLGWDPNRGLTFESFGFGILRRRANDIYRQTLGRNGEKPMANALSLNYMDDGGEVAVPDGGLEDVSLEDLRLAFEQDAIEELMSA